MDKYQVMPSLSGQEYDDLKSDIEQRGVMVPVEYDDQGNILDGHHRVKICHDLGITEWPRLIRKGMSEDEKRAHAISLNIARRHLSKDQRNDLISDMRQSGMTLQSIADSVGVSVKTVHRAVENPVLSNDKTDTSETIVGKDGKQYPATKPRKAKPRKTKAVKAKQDQTDHQQPEEEDMPTDNIEDEEEKQCSREDQMKAFDLLLKANKKIEKTILILSQSNNGIPPLSNVLTRAVTAIDNNVKILMNRKGE